MPTRLERRVWLTSTKACVLVCVWLGLSVCSPENLFLSVLYNTVPEHICPLLSALPSPSESLSIKHHDAAPRRLHLVDSWSPRLASRLLRTKVHQGARAAKRGELCGGRVRRPGPRERRRAAQHLQACVVWRSHSSAQDRPLHDITARSRDAPPERNLSVMLTDAPVSLLRRSPATMQPGCPSRASDLATGRSSPHARVLIICANHMERPGREPCGTAGW